MYNKEAVGIARDVLVISIHSEMLLRRRRRLHSLLRPSPAVSCVATLVWRQSEDAGMEQRRLNKCRQCPRPMGSKHPTGARARALRDVGDHRERAAQRCRREESRRAVSGNRWRLLPAVCYQLLRVPSLCFALPPNNPLCLRAFSSVSLLPPHLSAGGCKECLLQRRS